jgi:hypothetical protein
MKTITGIETVPFITNISNFRIKKKRCLNREKWSFESIFIFIICFRKYKNIDPEKLKEMLPKLALNNTKYKFEEIH